MSKFRSVCAWFAAIFATGLVYVAVDSLGHALGVPLSLDVDSFTVNYGHGAEGESNSITTASGWGATVLSLFAGFVAWHWVEGHPITPTGKADAWGWFVGSLVMMFGGIPVWKLFNQATGVAAFIGNMMELGLTAVALLIGMEASKRMKSTGRSDPMAKSLHIPPTADSKSKQERPATLR